MTVPGPPVLSARAIAAALGQFAPADEQVTLVGVGAIMPEVLAAAGSLRGQGVRAGVVCLTSPDLVFGSFQQRGRRGGGTGGDILAELLPASTPAPLVTVLDGHPHTLSFLAGARGDRLGPLVVAGPERSVSVFDQPVDPSPCPFAYLCHRGVLRGGRYKGPAAAGPLLIEV